MTICRLDQRIGEERHVGERRAIAEAEQQPEHDQHRQPEAGHREEQDADEARDVVAEAVRPQRADDGDGNADQPRQHDRDMPAISAVSGPRRAIMSATLSERKKEWPRLPLRMSPIQRKVLHHQRIAQTKLRHVAGARLGRELGEALGAEDRDQRIARQDAQHEEHDDGNAEYRDRTEGETTQDIAVHE